MKVDDGSKPGAGITPTAAAAPPTVAAAPPTMAAAPAAVRLTAAPAVTAS